MPTCRYLHLDVFTNRRFEGNQLAVFVDGRGLDAETMQAVAVEMAYSESTFILPPESGGTDVRMRIFTPGQELPMAGHPTIGSTFALAHEGVIAAGRSRFVFGLGVGPTPVALEWNGGRLAFAWMTQRPPVFGPPIAELAGLAEGLGVRGDDIVRGLPVQSVSCGVPFLFVPLGTRAAVDAAAPDKRGLEEFYRRRGVESLPIFVFSTERGGEGATAYSRMFAVGFGIAEDPATGAASGPLGSYLVRHRLVTPSAADRIISRQGVKMGRPSTIHIAIGVTGSEITDVRVGGEAVMVGEGALQV